jgi:hypothetical protein
MVERNEISAHLFSDFLIEQEEDPNDLRYVFVGFERRFLKRLISIIKSKVDIPIDFLDVGKAYKDVIDSRAISRPVILAVSKSRAGEFASLLTFKTFTNEYELPFQRPISKTARAFNLYDVSQWIFTSERLEKTIKTHFPHIKQEIVSEVTLFLRNVWLYAQRHTPGLKYIMSPEAIITALLTLNARPFDLNLVAKALGFDPSLGLVSSKELEKRVDIFLRKSDKVRRLFLKGTYLEQRQRLARLLENLVRGILSLLSQDSSLCERKNVKDAEGIMELFEKIENRRRIFRVIPRNVQILGYSQSSMLPKSVAFGIQYGSDEQYATSRFLPRLWKDVAEAFAASKGFSQTPIIFSAKDPNIITITFNFLEGYDFALQRWRR